MAILFSHFFEFCDKIAQPTGILVCVIISILPVAAISKVSGEVPPAAE